MLTTPVCAAPRCTPTASTGKVSVTHRTCVPAPGEAHAPDESAAMRPALSRLRARGWTRWRSSWLLLRRSALPRLTHALAVLACRARGHSASRACYDRLSIRRAGAHPRHGPAPSHLVLTHVEDTARNSCSRLNHERTRIPHSDAPSRLARRRLCRRRMCWLWSRAAAIRVHLLS